MVKCRIVEVKQGTFVDASGKLGINPDWHHITIECDVGSAYASVYHEPTSGYCEIENFSTEPMGEGIGRVALPVVEKHLKDWGCKKADIQLVGGTEGFWEKMGYREYPNQDPGLIYQRAYKRLVKGRK